MIRVFLPFHLRNLAKVEAEILLEIKGPVTLRSILDSIELKYPMLRGTIRDQQTHKRRSLIRFFACEQDFSNLAPDDPLPDAIAMGEEPLLIIGAIAGG